ncbi:OLC1v1030900C1 [Oldenlandia corymbosa var. corymbosa]|uniref:OLC1v1030900C1 n=1 Tax=Oldenlandia corymbosa var. corymbosa TaxID=529605 RepID=A0AAV1CIY2_OLDCO|nr:OLC1v1030900C1 [Oldenlandia corymbosa var. corymbosa]
MEEDPILGIELDKRVSTNCSLLTGENNKLWPVKIRKKDHYYHICKLSWSEFARHHDLKHGDYLFFRLVDKRTIKVVLFGPNGCQKKRFYGGDSPSDEDENEDEDETNDEKNIKTKYKQIKDASASKSYSPNFKKTRNSSGAHQANNITSEILSELTKFGGYFDLEAKNPYYIKTMKKHTESFVIVPKLFARGTKLDKVKDVILRSEEDMKAWPAKILKRHDGRIDIGNGWSTFREKYNVKIGETMKFTLFKINGKFVFNVENFPILKTNSP